MGIEDFANPSSSEEVLHSGGYSPHSLLHPWSLSNEEGVRTKSPGCDTTGNVHLGRSAGETNGLIPFTTGTKSALPNEPPRYPFWAQVGKAEPLAMVWWPKMPKGQLLTLVSSALYSSFNHKLLPRVRNKLWRCNLGPQLNSAFVSLTTVISKEVKNNHWGGRPATEVQPVSSQTGTV